MSESVLNGLRGLLDTGDLTCELSDHGLGNPLVSNWFVRLGEEAFVGTARVVDAAEGDVPSVRSAASRAARGDVLVVSAGKAPGAVFGGNLGAIATERGLVGVVVDGWIRDLPQLRQTGLALRARGAVPNRSVADGSGTVGGSVVIDGVEVSDGDIVVADGSGIVVVPSDRVPTVMQFVRQAGDQERKE